MNYLVREITIHYAPSAKFLLQNQGHDVSNNMSVRFATIFSKSETNEALNHSAEEINFARSLFEGDVYLNEEASKNIFVTQAKDYELIHLSTHAGLGSGKNNDGWIAFSSPLGAKRLLTPELLELDLSASLVVLNGCETGIGEMYKGEGMMSMARGFIQAGAQSAITNLWQVNHDANARLMQDFYAHLSESNSPAGALKQAKIEYIKSDDVDEMSAHPYYWSASILVGTNAQVDLKRAANYFSLYLLIAGIGVAFLGVFIYFRRTKK